MAKIPTILERIGKQLYTPGLISLNRYEGICTAKLQSAVDGTILNVQWVENPNVSEVFIDRKEYE